ncbi:MAG: Hint domain-containing protein, partial [Streptosporangiaceae bacterium]
GASHPGMILAVGVSERGSAGEGRGQGLPQPRIVSGACVAAEDQTAAACGGESFTGGTKVLTAAGTLVAISRLKPGQKVLATNTKTGKTTAKAVAAVLVRHDTDRYDLKVKTTRGTAVIDTTRSHLFWDASTGRWVKAAFLKHGTHLRTPGGGSVTVLSGYAPGQAAGWMWDLTVAGDHDFYIDPEVSAYAASLNGNQAKAPASYVLVHNVVCRSLPSNTGANYIALGTREDIQVVRDWEDTEHEVLTLPRPGEPGGWTPERNDEWVAGAIAQRQTAFLASPLTDENIFSDEFPSNRGTTVFGREVFQLLDARYTIDDSETYMFPPPGG